MRTLVRSAKYHRDAELVLLYKAKVLSYLEYRTAAVYHATDTALLPLNAVQDRFLRKVGVSELEALMVFNLAPLATRRDMAMLGVVHRAALRKGPSHFWKFFQPERDATHLHWTRLAGRRHSRHLKELRQGRFLEVFRRSALELTAVYNLLPNDTVKESTVKDFQGKLRLLLEERATSGCEDWAHTFSPRVPLWRHPLR